MMGKRTSSAKMLNKEAKGNGSSVDQQILATLKEIKKKLDDIEAAISDEMRGDKLDAILDELKAQRSESSEEGEDRWTMAHAHVPPEPASPTLTMGSSTLRRPRVTRNCTAWCEELLVTVLRRGARRPRASAVRSVVGSVVKVPWGVSSSLEYTRHEPSGS